MRLDARFGQLLLHVGALVLEGVDTQIQRCALRQAFHQRPEAVAQLVLEGFDQPFGQVVAMALHQVVHRDRIALVEPFLFLLGQGALEKIARTMLSACAGASGLCVEVMRKPQDGQTTLFGARTRGGHVIEQQLFAQHGVDRFRQRGALARPQAPVVAEKT